eukprot:TRINITY_DN56634_c0_g1_i1.p1 TRINITY_DN56634_c0_g1~~TRINITY_DN56634_c0_g1_i1.p1  ORF type:complete len:1116 (+),score=194.56 TRINITY_DN56634_c0_g1_i1:181-3528(+)
MALSSLLSEKGLARFRTKRCERLLASGQCSFGDKCQYSHDSEWLRRNPIKVPYAPDLCPCVARSGISGCAKGLDCSFAHSSEEVLYHPRRYKRVSCAGSSDCRGYYCPFAHNQEELRQSVKMVSGVVVTNQDDRLPASSSTTSVAAAFGGQSHNQAPSAEVPSVAVIQHSGSHGSGGAPAGSDETGLSPSWCKVDDILWIDSNAMTTTEMTARELAQDLHYSEALLGPRTVSGLLAVRGEEGRRKPCRFHLFSTSRIDREEAAHVMRDLKRWMALPPLPSAPQSQAPRALALRRTVATIYLALPEDSPQTLGQCKPCLAQGADLPRVLLPMARSWLRPLAEDLQQLHRADIAHLCLSPGTVLCVESSNSTLKEDSGSGKSGLRLLLGDFLGKIRSLVFLNRGATKASKEKMCEGRDPTYDAWCAWQPPEVQLRIVQLDSAVHSGTSKQRSAPEPLEIDHFKVDSWQLGVVIFFLLTGQHPFGIHEAPKEVCRNISTGLPVNLPSLESISLHFFDLVGKLLAHRPEDRPCLTEVLEHHALWTSERVAQFASDSLIQPSLPSASFEIAADDLLEVPALQALRMFERRSEQSSDAASIDVQPGSCLQCVWQEELQYRHSPNGSDKAGKKIVPGEEVVALERSRDWIRTSVGWLPFFGLDDTAQRVPLFKVVKPKTRRRAPSQEAPADSRIWTPEKPGLLSKSNQNTPVKVSPRLSVLLPTAEESGVNRGVNQGIAGVRPSVKPAHTERRKVTSGPSMDDHRHQPRQAKPYNNTAACLKDKTTPTVLRPPGLFPQSAPISTHRMSPVPDPMPQHQLSSHQSMQQRASAWPPGTQSFGGVQMLEQGLAAADAARFAEVTASLRSPAPVLPPSVAPPPGLPSPAPVPPEALAAALEQQAACGDLRNASFDASMRHAALLQGAGMNASYAAHAAQVWDAYFAAGFQAAFQELTAAIHYPPSAPDWQQWQEWQQAELDTSGLKLPAVLPAMLPQSVLATQPCSPTATAVSPPESPALLPAPESIRVLTPESQSSGHDAGQSALSTDAYVAALSTLDLVADAESVPAKVPLPAGMTAASVSAKLDCSEDKEEEPDGLEGSLFWSLPNNTLNGQPPTPLRRSMEI